MSGYDSGVCRSVKLAETEFLLDTTHPQRGSGPRIIPRSEHIVSRANVSGSALKVLYRLRNSGFDAYLVGGGVRDLLLGMHPKDFDIVTDAHPEQVRKLFGNSRLIGRRFRLAHVRFGREIIEVATFRGKGDGSDERERAHSGRILRDNVYGSIDEDIWRRDFTVNALYYNIADFSVVDYTTGLEDIRRKTLRMIGDPVTRYREDPVRMLRVARFAAKLGFEIAQDTAEPIAELGHHVRDVPPARLFEEVLKLFRSGHAVASFRMLDDFGLLRHLFPATAALLEGNEGDTVRRFIERGLAGTDRRIAEDKPTTPAFLYAILLWPAVSRLAASLKDSGAREFEAMAEASTRVAAEQQRCTALPKRFSVPMKEMFALQRRFATRRGARAARVMQHRQFRAAYDFLLLRSRSGEVEAELANWWSEVQTLPPAEREQAFNATKRRRGKRRRGGRRGGRRKPLSADA